MRLRRWSVLLAPLNLALLVFLLLEARSVGADDRPGMLRGTGLQIVDAEGRVRASISVLPADPAFRMPDGTTGYPETVILRLITADGKPRVKLTTATDASGLMLLGDTDTTQTILSARGRRSSLKLRNDETREKVLEP